MNIIKYIPIKTMTAAIVTGIIILVAGYFLYGYFQKDCGPCPIGIKCAPCTSKGQQGVLFTTIFLELVVLGKAMLLQPDTPKAE